MLNVPAIFDSRVACWSVMVSYDSLDYLRLVKAAYENRGGLDYQRDKLKTTTARRIRARMVEDILKGAVLPPVVIGLVVPEERFEGLSSGNIRAALDRFIDEFEANLSIIDGMQRTSALIEAAETDTDALNKHTVRVEFWIASSVESLIYRMLVLNTGQVPWNLSRQLQVVYAPIVDEIRRKVNFTRLLDTAKPERRTKGGEFSPVDLVELFIAFGLRKTEYDTKENLADEFSRLDMADALSHEQYKDIFYPAVQMMVDFDIALTRCDQDLEKLADDRASDAEIGKGRRIFDRKPARVGFIVALANQLLGRIGIPRTHAESQEELRKAQFQVNALIARLGAYNSDQMKNFLQLDILDEKLGGSKRAAVGRFERDYFLKAFSLLIELKFDVPTMEPCWRA